VEPVIVTIVNALAAGAAAAAKDVATSAIKDAYAGLKRLIVNGYGSTRQAVDLVAGNPASEACQAVLAEELEKTGAAQDEALKAAAQVLLDGLASLRWEPRAAAMFDFGRLRAARNFELEDIETGGTVLRAEQADFGGDFKATGVRHTSAGGSSEKH
jgi:hypothetical protein